jgi:hypothetical protein
MNEQRFTYESTDTRVKIHERGIKGAIEFSVGGPVAASCVCGVMKVANELDAELSALRAELARKDAAIAAARVAIDDIAWYMDAHEDDGGILCCRGCDVAKGVKHFSDCKVAPFFTALDGVK